MSKTISFVARGELADWIESQAEAEMKSVSAYCNDIIREKYREEQGGKPEETPEQGSVDLPELTTSLGDELYEVDIARKSKADAVRTEFSDYLHGNDDRRTTEVRLVPDTPNDVLREVKRRSTA